MTGVQTCALPIWIAWTRHAQNSQPLLITVTCLSISPRVGAWCGSLDAARSELPALAHHGHLPLHLAPGRGVVRISWTRHAQNSQPLLITVTSPPVTPRAISNTYSYSLCEQRLTLIFNRYGLRARIRFKWVCSGVSLGAGCSSSLRGTHGGVVDCFRVLGSVGR